MSPHRSVQEFDNETPSISARREERVNILRRIFQQIQGMSIPFPLRKSRRQSASCPSVSKYLNLSTGQNISCNLSELVCQRLLCFITLLSMLAEGDVKAGLRCRGRCKNLVSGAEGDVKIWFQVQREM